MTSYGIHTSAYRGHVARIWDSTFEGRESGEQANGTTSEGHERGGMLDKVHMQRMTRRRAEETTTRGLIDYVGDEGSWWHKQTRSGTQLETWMMDGRVDGWCSSAA